MSDRARDLGKTPDTTGKSRGGRALLRDHNKKKEAADMLPPRTKKARSKRHVSSSEDDRGISGSDDGMEGNRQDNSMQMSSSQAQTQAFQQAQAWQQQAQAFQQAQAWQQQAQAFQQAQAWQQGQSPYTSQSQFFPQTPFLPQPPLFQQPFLQQPFGTPLGFPVPIYYTSQAENQRPDSGYVPQYGTSSSASSAGLLLTSAPHYWETPTGRGEEEEEGGDQEEEGGDPEEYVQGRRARNARRNPASHVYDPELQEGLRGGPEIPSVLKGFEAHVTYDIYHNKERQSLKFQRRIESLSAWHVPLSQEWGDIVRNSCFGHIVDSLHENVDVSLLSAFIERWQPETNSFHLPCGEMTITLHDVNLIMDLPINGNGMAYSDEVFRQGGYRGRQDKLVEIACERFRLKKEYIRGGTISWQAFQNHMKLARHRWTQEDKALAYMVFLLSTTLLPDKTQDKIDLRYATFFESIQSIDTTAWGEGVLCHLYRSLGECTRAECRGASFCYTLLHAWIYQHFPCFSPRESEDWDPSDLKPWAARWFHETRPSSVSSYRLALDQLTVGEVNFMPYGELNFEDEVLAPSLFHRVLSCLHDTESYMPDRVARQFWRVQCVPRDVIAPIKAHRRRTLSKYTVHYDASRWVWNSLSLHSFSLDELGPETEYPHQCHDDYMDWYKTISHRFVSSPGEAAIRSAGISYHYMRPHAETTPVPGAEAMYAAMMKSMRQLEPFYTPPYPNEE